VIRVHLHHGPVSKRSPGNRLATVDIAYARQGAFSDYMVAATIDGLGEVAPDTVKDYPRWSGSLWDLTARAITRVLYRDDNAPPLLKPDRRCAYANQLSAIIERATLASQGVELGRANIVQDSGTRGLYTATFEEDILGTRSAQFEYGLKSLQPLDLLLRAICFAYFGQDTLAARPKLILPPTMRLDGNEVFDVAALAEPARTGFLRQRETGDGPMALADDYARFLVKG
jgi:hypothetical protein